MYIKFEISQTDKKILSCINKINSFISKAHRPDAKMICVLKRKKTMDNFFGETINR
jgi:hypothetical protein